MAYENIKPIVLCLYIYFVLQTKQIAMGVHTGWVTKILYVEEIDVLVTASLDGSIQVLDVRKLIVLRHFTGHSKAGVRCFSWSGKNKYLASAGDRDIMLWDPHTMDSIYVFDSLTAPVVDLMVHDPQDHMVAVTTDKSIHLWHSITYEPLQTIVDSSLYRPLNALSAMLFVPELHELYSAGNRLTAWTMDR